MTSTVLCAFILLSCVLTLGFSQMSCKGLCGSDFYRGALCQCDYNCLLYGECCKDYESQCTARNSCKGRCGESFKRGRLCSCDPECMKYKQCCSDFEIYCGAEEPTPTAEDSSMYSEGNQADDSYFSQDSPTSQLAEELGDDMYGNIIESGDLLTNGMENPEGIHVPESSSDGFGPSTTDLLAQVSTKPTQSANTEEITPEAITEISKTQSTSLDDAKPFTAQTTSATVTTKSTDAGYSGETNPQPTTAPGLDFIKSTSTTVSQTETANLPNTSEAGTVEQAETSTAEDSFPSDEPGATSTPFSTHNSVTILENSQVTTTPSLMADMTTVQEETASVPSTDSNSWDESYIFTSFPSDTEDPITSVSPEASSFSTDLNAVTTHAISSAAFTQSVITENVTPEKATTDPSEVTPNPTTHQDTPDPNPQDKPDPNPQDNPDPNLQDNLDPNSQDNPDPNPQDNPDPNPQDNLDPNSQDKPDPNPQDKPDPNPQDNPDPNPQDKPDPNPQDTPDPNPQDKPGSEKPAKPTTELLPKPQDTVQTLNTNGPKDVQSDDSHDTNLCSGRPISGVTTLRNGTTIVFRGHYFWSLDSNREPGPARGITEVWGVPSPIDTVFTRCNCLGKTYIFRGGRYWRFENDVLDPGYPRDVLSGFDGLQGHITAALSVPQYQSRRESVYFFKRGGVVQKYSYQFGTSPSCGKKVQYAVYTVPIRRARQAVSVLGPAVKIQTSWRGFPSTVTAAVSIPSSSEPEGYKYYVFSRTKPYRLTMAGGRPVVSIPKRGTSTQTNDIFKCPKKV